MDGAHRPESTLMTSELRRSAFSLDEEEVFTHGLLLKHFSCFVLYNETRLVVVEESDYSTQTPRVLFNYHTKGDCLLRHLENVKHEEEEEGMIASFGFMAVFEYSEEKVERWYIFDIEKLGFVHLAEFEHREALYASGRMGKIRSLCGRIPIGPGSIIPCLYVIAMMEQGSILWFCLADWKTKLELIARRSPESSISVLDAVWTKEGLLTLTGSKDGLDLNGYYLDSNKNIHQVTFEDPKPTSPKFTNTILSLDNQSALICGTTTDGSSISLYYWDSQVFCMRLKHRLNVKDRIVSFSHTGFLPTSMAYLTADYRLKQVALETNYDQHLLHEHKLEAEFLDQNFCDLSLDEDTSLCLLTTKQLICVGSHLKEHPKWVESYASWTHGQTFPYSANVIQETSERRRTLGGQLFFDRLMSGLDISGR
jgi:hypothetical protein